MFAPPQQLQQQQCDEPPSPDEAPEGRRPPVRRGSVYGTATSFYTVWGGSFRTARSSSGGLEAGEGDQAGLLRFALPVRQFPVTVALLRLWYLLLLPLLLCAVTLPLEALCWACRLWCGCGDARGAVDLRLGRTPPASPPATPPAPPRAVALQAAQHAPLLPHPEDAEDAATMSATEALLLHGAIAELEA